MMEFMRGIRTPVSTVSIPAEPMTSSINAGYLASRSRMRNLIRAAYPVSSRSMSRLRMVWVTQAGVGWAVVPTVHARRLTWWMTERMYWRWPVSVIVSISHTVDAAIATPRSASSPWMRRYPHEGFPVARRKTRRRIEATVRGRPGVWFTLKRAWRRLIRSRCHLSPCPG